MNSSSANDPLAPLADEFLERYRRGERPSPEEYVARAPELAAEIRELFPALLVMEKLGGSLAGEPPHSRETFPSTPPQRLGDYRILRQVGRGGMGVVYEAIQESLGRHVALKVLPSTLASQGSFLERFKREARAAARLHHTNIVPVFGVGECEGAHYYAMQFIHGQGLDAVLNDVRRLRSGGPSLGDMATVPQTLGQSLLTGQFALPAVLNPGGGTTVETSSALPESTIRSRGIASRPSRYVYEVARLGVQGAQALAHAHALGVLHRDIKPANLLLDSQGSLWVTDFGLAKADDSENITVTGDIVGTLRYMAPERFNGQGDARSDVYGLGVTLYEMLTLRPAFEESDRVRLIAQVTAGNSLSPRRIDPTIPRDLETIVLKAMARDPEDRYATAAELADDLSRFLADRPIKARRHRLTEQLWRWGRRNPVLAGLTGTILLLLVFIAVGFMGYSYNLSEALERSEHYRHQAEERLLESFITEARARRFSMREGQRHKALDAIRAAANLARKRNKPPETFHELRDLAIAVLALPDVSRHTWAGRPHGNGLVILDNSTLQRSANLDDTGDLTLVRIEDGSVLASLQGHHLVSILFEPGRDSLLVLDNQGVIKRWSPASGTIVRLATTHCIPLGRWELNADGKFLLLVQTGATTKPYEVLDLDQGVRIGGGTISGEEGRDYLANGNVTLSPEGRRVAAVGGAYGTAGSRIVRILDLASGAVQGTLGHPGNCVAPTWFPDGNILAVGQVDSSEVHLWKVSGSEVRRLEILTDLRGGDPHPAVSRGGQLLAITSGWQGGTVFWHPYGEKPILRIPDAPQFTSVVLDGRLASFSSEGENVHLLAAEPSPVLQVLLRNPAQGKPTRWRGASVHREGRLLAVGSDNGVSLFDLATGWNVAQLPVGDATFPSFIAETGELLTYGEEGAWLWPVKAHPEDASRLQVGPPRRLPSPTGASDVEIATDRRGEIIALAAFSSAYVIYQRGKRVEKIGALPDCRNIALSPDGKWLTTGGHWGGAVHLWELPGAKLVNILRPWMSGSTGGHAWFNADGQWLTSPGTPSNLLHVGGKWETHPRPGWSSLGVNPFSPDGRLLILPAAAGKVQLHEAKSGRRLATLELPDLARTWTATFTPDGRRLVLTSDDMLRTYVWDLPALRSKLAELGLDWDTPAYPISPTSATMQPLLQVQVDPGSLPSPPTQALPLFSVAIAFQPCNPHAYLARAHAFEELNDAARAIADYSSALELLPRGSDESLHAVFRRAINHQRLHNAPSAAKDLQLRLSYPVKDPVIGDALARQCRKVAWTLATGLEPERSFPEALSLARMSVHLAPEQTDFWHTLAVVALRSGECREAITALEKSCPAGREHYDGVALYLLCLCHHRLGEVKQAQACFADAEHWRAAHRSLSGERLTQQEALRREARKLLTGAP